jgi:hypothetical protein
LIPRCCATFKIVSIFPALLLQQFSLNRCPHYSLTKVPVMSTCIHSPCCFAQGCPCYFQVPPSKHTLPRPSIPQKLPPPHSASTSPASSVSLQTPPDAHGPGFIKVGSCVSRSCFVGCASQKPRLCTGNLHMPHGLSGNHPRVIVGCAYATSVLDNTFSKLGYKPCVV